MKIGSYEFTKGPNWQFYAVSAFMLCWSIVDETPWPLFGWMAFCGVLIPVCILIRQWEEKSNEQMCKDFPDDPYIQEKYGKKK